MTVEPSTPTQFWVDTQHRKLIQACISACFECSFSCISCSNACMSESNLNSMRQCIRLNDICADLCVTTGRALSRLQHNPNLAIRAQLEACMQACQRCAEECERHMAQHNYCQACAEACRRCESACQVLLHASSG